MSYQRAVDEVGVLREVGATATQASLYEDFRARGTFGSLDALRGLSILAVIWHHTLLIPRWFERWVPGSAYGFLGVDLFFVLSGFLIVTLLLRERDARGHFSLKHFYLRRALRIFPLYYGALLCFSVMFFVLRPDGSGAEPFRRDLPYLLFYLTNWHEAGGMLGITWSLSAEEQFYVFWPPLERFLRGVAVPAIVAVILVSEVIHFGLLDEQLLAWFGWPPDEPRMLRQTTFAPICMGVLLAHALHHRPTFERLARLLGHRAAAPTALVALMLGVQLLSSDVLGAQRLFLHLGMVALLGAVVVREDHGLRWLCQLRPLVRIGALSYGVYLLHMPVIGAVNALLARLAFPVPFGDLVLGTALTMVVAELSYRFYETPFLKLKRRFE